jgi:hypothetical protein
MIPTGTVVVVDELDDVVVVVDDVVDPVSDV